MGKPKEIIRTDKAPAPIGPYSQAVKAGGFVFVSGQVAIDPVTQSLHIGDIETETRFVMKNTGAILEAAGLTFIHVVKATIFLRDMNDFAKVNAIYGESFPVEPPARETVQVSRLPKDVNVEISVIAVA